MHVSVIESIERLRELRSDWEDLYLRSPAATPFQRPQWLLPWWETFGSGQLFTIAVFEHSRLVGLAPMFLHLWEGRQQITFLGNGVSDYLDFVIDGDAGKCVAEVILQCIGEASERWTVCDLQDIVPASLLHSARLPQSLTGELCPHFTCSEIELPALAKDFVAGLPHGLRRNLRRYREHLAGAGEIRFETVRKDFAARFDALFELHRARWRTRAQGGMFEGISMERFHLRAATELHERGIARLHFLWLNGQIIAAVYAFCERGVTYSYQGGFDPAFAQFSPGALILEYTIRHAIEEGCTRFDFLRGEERYKLEWGAAPRSNSRLQLSRAQAPAHQAGTHAAVQAQ